MKICGKDPHSADLVRNIILHFSANKTFSTNNGKRLILHQFAQITLYVVFLREY
jgi:hypothetical protein